MARSSWHRGGVTARHGLDVGLLVFDRGWCCFVVVYTAGEQSCVVHLFRVSRLQG